MPQLNRTGRQSARERGQLRRRLRDLGERREQMIRDLGGLALEMHKRDRLDPELLTAKAAEIDAVDSETKLLRRALEERLSSGEIESLADQRSALGPARSQPQ
jgi:hypothetical protein